MKITTMGQQNGWMSGTIEGGYEWEAKVYKEPSEFGINGGRVSKLYIWPAGQGQAPALVSYDRGWDKEPETPEVKANFKALLNYLENT